MTNPTGVFVRLPLSAGEVQTLENRVCDYEEALLAIGTPVTGGDLVIAGCIAPKQAEKAEKGNGGPIKLHPRGMGGKRYTVNLTHHDIAIAKLSERDAEIARLRGFLEKAHQSAILGDVDPQADLDCCRQHIEEALKSPGA